MRTTDAANLETLKNIIRYFKNLKYEDLIIKWSTYNDNVNSSFMENTVKPSWEKLSDCANRISENLDKIDIKFISQKIELEYMFSNWQKIYHILEENNSPSERFSLTDFNNLLSGLGQSLEALKNLLPITFEFIYNQENSIAVTSELKSYIDVGEKIWRSSSYKNSDYWTLEQLLIDPKETLLKHYTSISSGLILEKSFIALICPSFTGKTQSAFIYKSLRPLYFPLRNLTSSQSYENIQNIYKNFKSLSDTLFDLSFEDMKLRINVENENLYNLDGYDKISESALSNIFKDKNFATLGFIWKLIQDAEKDFHGQCHWMEFHTNRKNFHFTAKSIEDVKKEIRESKTNILGKYYLFLDEFIGFEWAILIRNLARTIGLRVVVANTNSKIANLAGISGNSRQLDDEVWSIVFNSLRFPSWDIIHSAYDFTDCNTIKNQFDLKKIEILDKCQTSEHIYPVEEFFLALEKNYYTRPGVLQSIFEAILKFDVHNTFDALKFLNFIFNFTSKEIMKRKKLISESIFGHLAQLALNLSNAYIRYSARCGIWNMTSYIHDHLFFLNNPTDISKPLFPTFTSNINGSNLLVLPFINGSLPTKWVNVSTFFDENEIFTLLACIFFNSPKSLAIDLIEGVIEHKKLDRNVLSTPNPLALKNNGNDLEVLSSLAIIDASRRQHGSLESSLKGQNGIHFLQNLIGNLIISDTHRKTDLIDFIFPDLNDDKCIKIEDILSNCHVPFLFTANLSIPIFLADLGKIYDSINIGDCHRTSDKERIDFKFKMYFYNQNEAREAKKMKFDVEQSIPNEFYALVECKNWANSLTANSLMEILTRFYEYKSSNPFICFLICNTIEGIKAGNVPDTLKSFIKRNSFHLYRFEAVNPEIPIGSKTFKLNPLVKMNSKPKLIVFIIENKNLNPDFSFS